MEKELALDRGISTHQLYSTKFDLFELTGAWRRFIGTPEQSGVIFIWGDSGHGKTWFSLQFAKELSKFTNKVAYDSLEEGKSFSQQRAWKGNNMIELGSKIMLLDKEPLEVLDLRLKRKRSPNVVFLDSWQYVRKPFWTFVDFVERHNKKLFVVTSQEKNGKPKGKSADDVRFHADVKIHIKGYIAFAQSRVGESIPYIIWEKGARDYHGDKVVDEILKQHTEASLN